MPSHARQISPAAERNQTPIRANLQRLLPAQGRLLEIASGTGQHAVFCAAGLPGWTWQPSDPSPAALASIEAWRADQPVSGLQAPWQIDVLVEPWAMPAADTAQFDAVFCANMLHIAPWACCAALMRGAARLLTAQGLLITYGPYLIDGVPTAPGNLAFDADLRARNPDWGLRSVKAVAAHAGAVGLHLASQHPMPANNLMLVFSANPAATPAAGIHD